MATLSLAMLIGCDDTRPGARVYRTPTTEQGGAGGSAAGVGASGATAGQPGRSSMAGHSPREDGGAGTHSDGGASSEGANGDAGGSVPSEAAGASSGGRTDSNGGTDSSGGIRSDGGGASDETGGSSSGSGGKVTSPTGGNTLGGAGGAVDPAGGAPAETGGAAPAACPPVCGPSNEAFYDNDKLATLRVSIDPAYLEDQGYDSSTWLELLWAKWTHCPPFDLVPVTMQYESPDGVGNVTLQEVGMRLRGSWERGSAGAATLQGFKLDFQTLLGAASGAERRRFADINRLNILSLENDPSHMIQCLAYRTLARFGVPAPKCNHLKVYVNDQYYGLLENVEEVDHGRFLAHHFGTTEGLLIEASGGCGHEDGDADLRYRGDTFSDYQDPPGYKIERGTEAEAEASLMPMLQCADPSQTPDDPTFEACIQEWLDVDEWLKVLAADSLMPNLEAFLMLRNYYLYFRPDESAPHGGRFVLYEWDLDTTFQRATCYPSSCAPMTAVAGWYGPLHSRPALAKRLTAVFKPELCAFMQAFLTEVYDPSLVDQMASVIEPGMVDDPTDTPQAWQTEVEAIRSFIISHETDLQVQISAACQ